MLLAAFAVAARPSMLGSYRLETQTRRTCGLEEERHRRTRSKADFEGRKEAKNVDWEDLFFIKAVRQEAYKLRRRMATSGEVREIIYQERGELHSTQSAENH